MKNLSFLTRCLILFFWPFIAHAAATALAVNGNVVVSPSRGAPGPLAVGQRIESGTTLKTAANAGTTLRFDDGQMIAVAASSNYVIDDYRFNPHKPEEGGFISTLIKGGIRSVTGLIGERNAKEVQVKTEVATIGIRGTDYNLFFDGRVYLVVQRGAVGAANEGGEGVFTAEGQAIGLVQDKRTKARPATIAEFSAEAQAAFRQLDDDPELGAKARNPSDPSCSDRR